MSTADLVGLVILIGLLGAQLWLRPLLVRGRKLIFLTAILAMLITLLWQAHLQFIAWLNAPPPARFLIPPYRPISYFLLYGWTHIFASRIIALFISLVFLILLKTVGRKFQNRFEPDEPILIALSIFLIGHPRWIIFAAITAIGYILYSLIAFLISKRPERRSFYHFWLPGAIATIALSPILLKLPFLSVLNLQ